MSKTPDQVIDEARISVESLALKIVKQHWIQRGVTPGAHLVKIAKDRITEEMMPFLKDVAGWSVSMMEYAERDRAP